MKRKIILFAALSLMLTSAYSQTGYNFTLVKDLPVTPVKDQNRSGTCWCFSGLSFFESELLRMGKGEYNLSEMFVVRTSYEGKADQYVRMHGNVNFAGGGAFNDVTYTLENYGIVPEEAYEGLNYDEEKHVHGELDAVLKSYMEGVITNRNRKLSTAWDDALDGILDAYLGKYPDEFEYKGKKYNPESFLDELELDMNDYVMVSSFTHHPFYESFILEVPDNWAWGEVYNVKIDELTNIIDYSINNGYTVAWATDVSEKGFKWKEGLAVVPGESIEDISGLERAKWDELSEEEKNKRIYDFSEIRPEKEITQEMRQEAFDNYQTTDDHGMHITGIAKDQKGNMYYKVKNSWGVEDHIYGGYLYASKAFVQYKTTSILVHKDGIPENLREKLGL
ncbi:MAG: aminopeptidase C [Bacteroidales bacterium]